MWVEQCHKPSPSHHHFYRQYVYHSQMGGLWHYSRFFCHFCWCFNDYPLFPLHVSSGIVGYSFLFLLLSIFCWCSLLYPNGNRPPLDHPEQLSCASAHSALSGAPKKIQWSSLAKTTGPNRKLGIWTNLISSQNWIHLDTPKKGPKTNRSIFCCCLHAKRCIWLLELHGVNPVKEIGGELVRRTPFQSVSEGTIPKDPFRNWVKSAPKSRNSA